MDILLAVLPSVAVGLLFWYVMRNILRADRHEREQMDKFYSEQADKESANSHDSDVKLAVTNTSETRKSDHGKGNATRPD